MSRIKMVGGRPAPPTPPGPLTVTSTPPATGAVGETYYAAPTITGGLPPYEATSIGSAIPSGTALIEASGEVTGVLTTVQVRSGVVIRISDSSSPTPQTADWVWPDVTISSPAPPPDAILQVKTDTSRWVDLTGFLLSIPDNSIVVTINGGVSMKVWGLYEPQTNGDTQTFYKRELKEYLEADATGAMIGAAASWVFTALDGPNETGSPITYTVNFMVMAGPPLTIDISSRTYAGMGGFPLSRFGTATDWVLNSQSTANAFALWNNEAVAWRGSTYLGSRTITNPTLGDAAYTATVSSASLGISNATITYNVRDDILDVRPSLANPTLAQDQLNKILKSGDTTGKLYYGDQIVCREGTFNPAVADNTFSPLQPTVGPSGTQPPISPYGTNIAPSWDYNDGWNPGWIVITSDTPNLTREGAIRLDCQNLSFQGFPGPFLGFRFSGIDAHQTSTRVPINIRDQNFSGRGVHGVAIDHCWDPPFYNDEGSYSTMWVLAYNWYDPQIWPLKSTTGTTFTDSQIIGNLLTHLDADAFNFFMINTVPGSGKTKFNFNVSIQKQQGFQDHADFYQPSQAPLNAVYQAIPAGSEADLGDWVGNWAMKGRGKLMTQDDVDFRRTYASGTVVGTFLAGETIQTAGGAKQATITVKISASNWDVQQTVGSRFVIGDAITGLTSGATATFTNVTYWTINSAGTALSSADIGKTTIDHQFFFDNDNAYRSNITHRLLMAGNMMEGSMQNAMPNMPRAGPYTYVVNNMYTYPWAAISEIGVPGAYYEKGRIGVGNDMNMPSNSGWSGTGALSARNVFTTGGNFMSGFTIRNNLFNTSYGIPSNTMTFVPTKILSDFNNPTNQAHYDNVWDVIESWTPTPTSQLRMQGTTEIFGPFDTGMIDFRRHTYDTMRLKAYS